MRHNAIGSGKELPLISLVYMRKCSNSLIPLQTKRPRHKKWVYSSWLHNISYYQTNPYGMCVLERVVSFRKESSVSSRVKNVPAMVRIQNGYCFTGVSWNLLRLIWIYSDCKALRFVFKERRHLHVWKTNCLEWSLSLDWTLSLPNANQCFCNELSLLKSALFAP